MIPKQLRDRLGVKPGAGLEFDEEHGYLVARRLWQCDPIDRVYGMLDLGSSTDDALEELRDPAEFL